MTKIPTPTTETPYSLYEIIHISIRLLFIIAILSAAVALFIFPRPSVTSVAVEPSYHNVDTAGSTPSR